MCYKMYRSLRRQISWGKLVIVLVVLVATLQIFHMVMLSRLEQRNARMRKGETVNKSKDGASFRQTTQNLMTLYKEYQRVLKYVQRSSVSDASGKYKIANRVTRTARNTSHDTLTIITHCSINNLYHLIALSKQWTGPISVVIFAPGHDMAYAIEGIVLMHSCIDSFKNNVTFNVVYPLTDPPNHLTISDSIKHIKSANCEHATEFINEIASGRRNYANKQIKYPNNLLRNVGISNANTEFIFVIDIDMIPSSNLHASFQYFVNDYKHSAEIIRKNSIGAVPTLNRTALVVPVFELRHNYDVPKTKNVLLDMVDAQKARQFYVETCNKCQRPTDYEAWEGLGEMPDLRIGYEVDWEDPWEPFYITKNPVPLYDERFKQFGFNRISQVCELYVAGYRFAILNMAFLVHKGYKKKTDFHQTKDMEQNSNRILFRKFKKELEIKYPKSDRRC